MGMERDRSAGKIRAGRRFVRFDGRLQRSFTTEGTEATEWGRVEVFGADPDSPAVRSDGAAMN